MVVVRRGQGMEEKPFHHTKHYLVSTRARQSPEEGKRTYRAFIPSVSQGFEDDVLGTAFQTLATHVEKHYKTLRQTGKNALYFPAIKP